MSTKSFLFEGSWIRPLNALPYISTRLIHNDIDRMKQSHTNIARKYKPMQTNANACSGMHHYAPYDIYNQYQNQYQNQNQIIVDDVAVHAREGNAQKFLCNPGIFSKIFTTFAYSIKLNSHSANDDYANTTPESGF